MSHQLKSKARTAGEREPLCNLRIVAIGGGPGGLALAIAARTEGADVTVLEQASDPRGSDPGYTNRSFNVTALQMAYQHEGEVHWTVEDQERELQWGDLGVFPLRYTVMAKQLIAAAAPA